MLTYRVVVMGVGVVYDGSDPGAARDTFEKYRNLPTDQRGPNLWVMVGGDSRDPFDWPITLKTEGICPGK